MFLGINSTCVIHLADLRGICTGLELVPSYQQAMPSPNPDSDASSGRPDTLARRKGPMSRPQEYPRRIFLCQARQIASGTIRG